jgi:hypothetical protein
MARGSAQQWLVATPRRAEGKRDRRRDPDRHPRRTDADRRRHPLVEPPGAGSGVEHADARSARAGADQPRSGTSAVDSFGLDRTALPRRSKRPPERHGCLISGVPGAALSTARRRSFPRSGRRPPGPPVACAAAPVRDAPPFSPATGSPAGGRTVRSRIPGLTVPRRPASSRGLSASSKRRSEARPGRQSLFLRARASTSGAIRVVGSSSSPFGT